MNSRAGPIFSFPARALPLTTQLSTEDEKVTRCITEILADTLSKPSPIPATSECMKILREDERVLAMLHHQHLLTELEELAHQENAKHRLGHEGNQDEWGGEDEAQEDVKKSDGKPAQQREMASERTQEQEGEQKEEEKEELKEYEKMEKTEEKVKAERVAHGNHEAVEEQAKEVMDEDEDEEEEEEARRKKKRSSSETWSSKEYFGHIKKRGPSEPKVRGLMVRGSHEDSRRGGLVKRHFRVEEDEGSDSSEEEPKKFHHGVHHGGRHHEDWADEEEEEEKKGSSPTKRVAEKASDEETAQFEEEGMKVSSTQSHLYGGWKPWQEKEEEEEEEEKEGERKYGGHHSKQASLDLKKRHQKDEVYWKGRHHGREGDEEEKGTARNEVQELEKLEEIERELKRAAEKLRKLKRG
ncbi:coiled-coil domain-containing glutamate-rich protein 2 [Tiliqua scincoides]|uniref:coiled-coil domain-containing glutamate-rich protein 2 n=1 Tax=Tiliqua scincoides TaxID=71010 RepID=UPI0034633EE5